MTEKDAFDAWAPPESAWSAWAKPVAFANLVHTPWAPRLERPSIGALPRADVAAAVVVDLPGKRAVTVGLGLADGGWQPVPLFNGNFGPAAIVDLPPLLGALRAGAELLRDNPPPRGAPPAFLLDADRMAGGRQPRPNDFDNRWVTFPQDFPSAAHLAASGIRRVIVIQDGGSIAGDLTHVLLRYREAGLEVLLLTEVDSAPVTANLVKPSRFRGIWYRALATLGLRRSMSGGFGGVVPDPQSAG